MDKKANKDVDEKRNTTEMIKTRRQKMIWRNCITSFWKEKEQLVAHVTPSKGS